MRLRLFKGSVQFKFESTDFTRVDVPLESPGGTYVAMILDADDSYDMIVHYPDGQREIVWSLLKETE